MPSFWNQFLLAYKNECGFAFIPGDDLKDKLKQIKRIIDKIEKLRLVEKTGKFAFLSLFWFDGI